jgi:cell volume regulation protein A
MIIRGNTKVIPKGDTEILPGDVLILVGTQYSDDRAIDLTELRIDADHYACGRRIADIRFLHDALVVLIKRQTKNGVKTLVPNGKIVISDKDVLVLATAGEKLKV